MRKILSLLLFLCLLIVPFGCSDDDSTATYTMTYNANGATGGAPPVDSTKYEAGGSVSISSNSGNLVRVDYGFVGWNTAADGGGTDVAAGSVFTMPAINVVLYAKWESWSYTVTFDGNGATTQANPTTMNVVSPATTLTTLPTTNPTKTGYFFAGWFTNNSGSGTTFTTNSVVSEEITLYAKWTINSYTVTFDSKGGSEVTAQTIDHGNKAVEPTAPTRSGAYSFGGWFTESGCITPWVFNSSSVSADMTLYGKWTHPLDSVTYKDLVNVSGGTYTQTDTSAKSFSHTISSFSMGKYEVTYELWYTVYQWAIANGYSFANAGKEGDDGTAGAAPTGAKLEPVTTVNWRDTIVWCNAYSEMMGYAPVYCSDSGHSNPIKDSTDGSYGSSINITAGSFDNPYVNWSANGYRLSTEGEWQYAASYQDGSSWTPPSWASGATADYNNATATGVVAWYSGNSGSTTQDVGTKTANQLGIYDMSGNVWEWCWDWYGTWPTESQSDYKGAASGSDRVLRGGYWNGSAYGLRVGYRDLNYPYYESNNYGFRVCRSGF